MARILEFLTVNIATRDGVAMSEKYRSFGLSALPAFPMPAAACGNRRHNTARSASRARFRSSRQPARIPLCSASSISAVRASIRSQCVSMISRVQCRNGPACPWVLDKPYEFESGNPAARYVPDKLRVNWIKPSSLGGVMLECFEFVGNVKLHDGH